MSRARRKKLTTADEAVPASRQHTKPCGDCPWRRDAIRGWLGGATVAEWHETAHGDGRVECHTLVGAQCAGISIYRANVCKLPRSPDVLRLPADREAVFSNPHQFFEHHDRKE